MSVTRLTGAVFELASAMRAQARPQLREFGLGFSQFHALAILVENDGITQHQLASNLGVSDAAVSRMLTGMQADGLITVQVNPNHQRQRLVSLTDEGREVGTRAASALERAFRQRTSSAGVDLAALSRELVSLKDALLAG